MTEPNDTSEAGRIQVYWNDPSILKAAGANPEQVRALMTKWGQPAPSNHAIYQWFSRRKITEKWRAPLLFALFSEGRIGLDLLFRRSSPARVTFTGNSNRRPGREEHPDQAELPLDDAA